MQNKIKLLCLSPDKEEWFIERYGNVFLIGEYYKGYPCEFKGKKMWMVYNREGIYGFHRPLENFITLAEWREKQINSILDDNLSTV
jgi:hypothetical protein